MEAIEKSSEIAASVFKVQISFVFLVKLILPWSLASLIGMVRSIKFLAFLNLIDIQLVSHALVFMRVLINFIALDIFDASGFYEDNLEINETI